MPPTPPAAPYHAGEPIVAARSGEESTGATLEATPIEIDADERRENATTDTKATGEPAGEAAAAPAAQPDRERTRLEILEALRGGAITTDEALLLLRQLDA